MLENKVDLFLKHQGINLSNKGVVIGVSGGPDSLALLHYLWSRRKLWNLSIVVAHVDHMFRGQESYLEATFVKKYCDELGIPCEITHIDVPAVIAKTNKNAQVASRESRYQFYHQVMEAYQYHYLALGHHGDDQIETILMRLTRGSSSIARAGILFARPFNNGQIIRPFLSVTRDEIEEYCKRCKLVPRRDPSNQKDTYSRNRFRKYVLPFLKKENPQVHDHFQRFSEEIQSDEEFLQELTVQKMNTVMRTEPGKISLDIKMFSIMPMPLQRRGIQLILKYLYLDRLDQLQSIHTDQIINLIKNIHPSGQLDLPDNLKVIRSYNHCIFQFAEECVETYHYEILESTTIELPNGQSLAIKFNQAEPHIQDCFSISLNPQQFNLPLVIRTRKNGDKMSIKGMSGTKKIKDIFIDQKVPIHLRNQWPIVTDRNDHILWLPGLKKSQFDADGTPDNGTIQLIYKCNDSSRGHLVMKRDIEKVLITEEEIQAKIKDLAHELTEEYQDKFPLAIGVLKGAMPFMGDLLKRIDTYLEMDFMDVSSYGNSTVSSGEVKILKDLDTSVEGRNILIIEDIIDSGLTLSYLVELFRYRKAKSIKIVTLLDKPTGRKADLQADYVGFVVPDAFVVGYGLDYAEKYRNLPYIGVLKPEVYTNNN